MSELIVITVLLFALCWLVKGIPGVRYGVQPFVAAHRALTSFTSQPWAFLYEWALVLTLFAGGIWYAGGGWWLTLGCVCAGILPVALASLIRKAIENQFQKQLQLPGRR